MAVVKGILGRKLGMTQLFDEQGQVVAATIVEAGPCVVVQRRTRERDGYDAVQLGYGEIREKHVNRPMKGHFEKAKAGGVTPRRVLSEFRLAAYEGLEVGSEIKAEVFKPGERVSVAGTTKGKGFSGVFRRYRAHGGPATHGSMFHRRPASAGATDAARVFKGTKRPGHHGAKRYTTRGLRVMEVHPEKNLLVLEGAVPGANGGLLRITVPVLRPRRLARVKLIS